MPHYDWREYQARPWAMRFPDWAVASDVWERGAGEPGAQLRGLVLARRDAAPARRRVFISHKQADVDLAVRLAHVVVQEGFEYWLDVEDPTLNAVGTPNGITGRGRALAIACVIEMALINSSHVLAIITPRTRASQWVPYEYGRVKEDTVHARQAASWIDEGMNGRPLPEFLSLGVAARHTIEVRHWLQTQLPAQGNA